MAAPRPRVLARRREARAEVRADGDGRTVTGVAVRYRDPTTVYPGVQEQIMPGAFAGLVDEAGQVNHQHCRERPLALPAWDDGDDALRVSFVLPAGARQDQALADARAGLLRGLSIEFWPLQESVERLADDDETLLYSVERARLLGVALVDAPAYESSTYDVRALQLRARAAGCGDDVRAAVAALQPGRAVEIDGAGAARAAARRLPAERRAWAYV